MTKHIIFSVFFCVFILFNTITVYGADEKEVIIPRFDITKFNVEGNRILKQTDIDHLLFPFTGKQRDFGTVQEAIDALEGAYRKRGYTTVQVMLPEQELEKGVVRLVIMETRIGAVRIEGNKHFSEKNIRRSFPVLMSKEAPNVDKISSSLKVANENPVKKIGIQLENSDKENEVNALLKVADEKPWKISLLTDTTGNKETGEFRTGVLLQHANIADLDHVLTLQYMTSPEKVDKVGIYAFGYHMPLYRFGDSIDLFASYADVDSGTIYAGAADLKISGRGSAFGARYNQNFRRIGPYEHKLSYGIDYRKFENNVTLLSTIPLDTDITVHPASLTYSGAMPFYRGETAFSLSFIKNIPGGSSGADEDFQKVRAGASANYTILRYGASFVYVLPLDMQFRLHVAGQYAHEPLVPGEQFGLGGGSSVRGYEEREVSDDIGNSGGIEIYSPDFFRLMNYKKAQLRILAFYDAGQVSKVDPLPSEESHTVMQSVGAGLRMAWEKRFSLSLDYGYGTGIKGRRAIRDSRFHLMAALSF